ncbi:Cupredoxin [Cerioporus squamosus]|nr:Cupredoxin [Cerioporus squamosus]
MNARVLAGGSFPGPLIIGQKGDHFQINVVDQLTNHTMLKSTSIHWHGFLRKGPNWADGPAPPGQAGTCWYRSHLSTQYCDGLRGSMVVCDPNDPHGSRHDVDNDDTVITLADWYHFTAELGKAVPFGGDSTVINGKGRSPRTPNAELPVLLQIMTGAQAASDLLPSGDIYVLPLNANIELSIPATYAGSSEYNYEHLIWRDVVSSGTVLSGDNVTIGYRTDNPGPWFLHCHIDFQLEAGFAVVMAEDTSDIKDANPVPQAWFDLCPIYQALPESHQYLKSHLL